MKSSQHKEILFFLACLMVTQVESVQAQVIWAGVAIVQIIAALFFIFRGD